MKNFFTRPVGELVAKNPFVENYKKMWPFVKPYWFRACLGLALALPVGALDATVALFMKYYTDDVLVAKDAAFAAFIPLLIIGFVLAQSVLTYLVKYLNSWVGNKITLDVRKKLFHKLLSMHSGYFDTTDSGYIMMRYNGDADTACNGLINNLRMIITRVFSSVTLIFVLFYNSWQLTLIAVGAFSAAGALIFIVRKKLEELVRNTVVIGSIAMRAYNETFNGNRTIAAYNLQEDQEIRFNRLMDDIFNLNMGMVKHTGWLSPVMHFIVSLGLALVFWQSSSMIVKGTITSGNFTSFVTALLMLYTPVKTMGDNYVDIKKAFLAIDRIFEIFSLKTAISDKKDSLELKGLTKEIRFKNVSFAYKPGVYVLKDVNLTVPAGKTVALVGNSGGGKSTVVSLLPRFYNVTKGAITIDGVNIEDFTLKSLRDHIAVVFQDNFLFSGTIRDNILIGRPGATEADLKEAVKNAHLDDFIRTLKNGLDTELGERGLTLSGGQRQRVAIARAFIRQAPIVILDEATSALDNKSEAVVQKALDNLMKNRTVFVIAHRLSTVVNADKIVVLNEGHIVEEGTHEELLKLPNGAYASLYNAQFKKKD
ncbi:ABC transporter ATP-binding protein [Candidatus Avelusimicrobium alvi]|uniref:ABC transporter ATP-binding protein n=1 Tax=Candidatus Avelusimicrobium alvi TaxID=3416221 RepID=UPI003D114218